MNMITSILGYLKDEVSSEIFAILKSLCKVLIINNCVNMII